MVTTGLLVIPIRADGQSAGNGQFHAESVSKSKKKAAIDKPVSVHTLRHCFATHLVEAGTDIFTIQELLGHKSIQTTRVYTHVQNKKTSILSPLDRLPGELL